MRELTAIKSEVSSAMRGSRVKLVGCFILILLLWLLFCFFYIFIFGWPVILSPLSAFFDGYSSNRIVYLLFPILIFLITYLGNILQVTYRWFALDILNGKKPSLKLLFNGVTSPDTMKLLHLVLLRLFVTFIWSHLFIIPGIYKAYMYSQAENNFKKDRSLKPIEALKLSEKQMKKHLKKYISLQLSYNIWYLLVIGLYIFLIGSNLFRMVSIMETEPENVHYFFSILIAASILIFSIVVILFIFIEPQKLFSKQVFFKEIIEDKRTSQYDDYEEKLLSADKRDDSSMAHRDSL